MGIMRRNIKKITIATAIITKARVAYASPINAIAPAINGGMSSAPQLLGDTRTTSVLSMAQDIAEQEENIRYVENALSKANKIYGESTEQIPDNAYTAERDIEDDWDDFQYNVDRLELNHNSFNNLINRYIEEYKKQTGSEIYKDFRLWRTKSRQPYINIYQLIDNKELSKYVSDSLKKDKEETHKLLDFPILSPNIGRYYKPVIEDLEKIIKLSSPSMADKTIASVLSRNTEIDPTTMAKCFLSFTQSPDVYRRFDFKEMLSYKTNDEYISNRWTLGTEEGMKDFIKAVHHDRREIGGFAGVNFVQISQTLKAQKEFKTIMEEFKSNNNNSNKKIDDSTPVNRLSSDTVNTIQQVIGWRLTNTGFIMQIEDLIGLIEEMIKTNSNYTRNAKIYIKNYRDEYITSDGNYFDAMNAFIADTKEKIQTVKELNFNADHLLVINKAVSYLAKHSLALLHRINMDSFMSENKLNEYKSLNSIPYNIKQTLIQSAKESWNSANLIIKYINVTEEERNQSSREYKNNLIKKLAALSQTRPILPTHATENIPIEVSSTRIPTTTAQPTHATENISIEVSSTRAPTATGTSTDDTTTIGIDTMECIPTDDDVSYNSASSFLSSATSMLAYKCALIVGVATQFARRALPFDRY
ncbi:hypothetical protein NEPAR08_0477 [Nematocida parisii]|nr:hypothetical protein NEPAR03_0488 [Nematocida parisii]KAI5126486.1 hypothetical protein NEPAR08_0477 [Nematocida parisii]